jgi:hypothetical protein
MIFANCRLSVFFPESERTGPPVGGRPHSTGERQRARRKVRRRWSQSKAEWAVITLSAAEGAVEAPGLRLLSTDTMGKGWPSRLSGAT